MEDNHDQAARIFTIEGADAWSRMERLTAYARTLGGFAVRDVLPAVELETPAESAATHLRTLLTQPGPYRTRWAEHAINTPQGEINSVGVTRVLLQWLTNHEPKPEGKPPTTKQIQDRVYRILSGKVVPQHTLELFSQAFDFTEADRANLFGLYFSAPEQEIPSKKT